MGPATCTNALTVCKRHPILLRMVYLDSRLSLQESRLRCADGISLALSCRGPRDGPTVLFAHGFGQTRQTWTGSVDALSARGLRCVSFDARGHGESDRVPGGDYHLSQFIDDLHAVTRAQSAPPILVGASMGGLLGLALAGEARSVPFRALVLVDITPRWKREGVSRILAFMRAHPNGFPDYEAAADVIATYLPRRRQRKSVAQLEPLLHEGADGRLYWHWDPALLSAVADEGERYQARLLDAARHVRIPLLLLSGGHSDVVTHETVEEFLELVPHAQHVRLPEATHMLAGDANDAFTDEIQRFVQGLDDTRHTAAARSRYIPAHA